jgi:Skp family chaperone for outer membrane proteins
MSRYHQWVASAVVLAAISFSVTAAAQTGKAPADTAGVLIMPGSAAEASPAPAPATPLEREVAAIRTAYRTRLAELVAVYAAAPDAAAASAAQREISAHKQKLELDLLGLQLRLARERNAAEAIAELEQSLTAARTRLVADTGLDVPAVPAATR